MKNKEKKSLEKSKIIKKIVTFDDMFRYVFTDEGWEYEILNHGMYFCADMYFDVNFIKECLFKGLKNGDAYDYYWKQLKKLETTLEENNEEKRKVELI